MPEYLVIATEDVVNEKERIVIIEAENPEEAKLLFIQKIGIHDETFLEYVYDQAMNSGYATRFWEKLYDLDAEDLDEWCKPLYDEDKIDDMFKDMVREFFGEHQDWAEMFIKHTFDEEAEIKFPEEMLTFMLLQEGENWCPYIVIPLDDLLRIPERIQ